MFVFQRRQDICGNQQTSTVLENKNLDVFIQDIHKIYSRKGTVYMQSYLFNFQLAFSSSFLCTWVLFNQSIINTEVFYGLNDC